MTTLVCVLCADDFCVAIDLDTLKNCPPVLGRFLGLGDGFAPPETDDLGRLTFAAKFGIIRDRFLDCLAFVRCGRVHDIHQLMDTFNVLGGCDALDKCYQSVLNDSQEEQARLKEEYEQRKRNPMTPQENMLGLFEFQAHPSVWTVPEGWETTMPVNETPHIFWWRKRISRE